MDSHRKIFHCVVDATALTHNISEIKKWTASGSITLIIPVYTLEHLHSLKQAPSQTGINAREAVRFLDRVTSGRDTIPIDKVVLQGPMEQYEKWAEAEHFLLPEYVEETKEEPKEEATETSAFALSQKLLDKLNFKTDPEAESTNSADSPTSVHLSVVSSPAQSSKTSPEITAAKLSESKKILGKPTVNGDASGSSITPKDDDPTTAVPGNLQSLLNAILWRLHNALDKSDSMANCMLISNDTNTQMWAQKLGITVRSVGKLRQSIIYEDREYKNRVKFLEKAQPENSLLPEPGPTFKYEDSDEEVVVFTPRGGRGARGSSRAAPRGQRPPPMAHPTAPKTEVPSQPIDPDSFSRTPGVTKYAKDEPIAAPAPRPIFHSRPFRGGFRGAPRGRGRLWAP